MTAIEAARASRTADWQDRVRYHLSAKARAVTLEAASVPNHLQRLKLAAQVQSSIDGVLASFALGVLSNMDVSGLTSTDEITSGALIAQIDTIYDSYSY